MTDNGMTTSEEAEEEYNAMAFLAKLFKEMDNPYVMCKTIMDEMDCGKERHERIFVEIYNKKIPF